MKRLIFLLLLTYFTAAINAQREFKLVFTEKGKAIAIPDPRKPSYIIPEYSFGKITPPSTDLDYTVTTASTDYNELLSTQPFNVQVLSAAYRPYFNPFTPLLTKASPTALDFTEYSFLPLNEKLGLFTTGQKVTYPFLAGKTTLSSMLVWQHERLNIMGGGFVGTFYTAFNNSPVLMGGLKLDLHYELSEKFALRGWGSYTVYQGQERKNPLIYTLPVFNYTGFGSALEFMFNENFGVGGGIEYEFNYLKGRLEPHPVVYPIFKIGNVTIGTR
jgi:hypothetical protein